MAQKVNIVMESDLSGKPEAETVGFALDGQAYEIDLTADEQSKFREGLAKYVGAARTVSKRGKRKAVQSGPSAKEVREWAQSNGYDVPDRGRIPAEVREAFDAADK